MCSICDFPSLNSSCNISLPLCSADTFRATLIHPSLVPSTQPPFPSQHAQGTLFTFMAYDQLLVRFSLHLYLRLPSPTTGLVQVFHILVLEIPRLVIMPSLGRRTTTVKPLAHDPRPLLVNPTRNLLIARLLPKLPTFLHL